MPPGGRGRREGAAGGVLAGGAGFCWMEGGGVWQDGGAIVEE